MVKAGVALVRRRVFSKRAGWNLVLIIVMTKVLGGLVLPMPAILSHRSPGGLEREQAQHKKHEETSHR